MLQSPQPHGFELVGHVRLFCNHVIIRGSLAYLANGWDGFSVLDISDIASPQLLGQVHSPNYAWHHTIHGNIAYVAEHPGEDEPVNEHADGPFIYSAGVQFIDITNPTKPVEIGRYIATDFVDDVLVHNDHLLILANHDPEPFTSTLLVVRTHDLNSWVLVGQCPISGRGQQLVVFGQYAYVAASDGLHVIDISDLHNPHETYHIGNSLSLHAFGIAIESSNLYVAAYFQGLRIFDITNEGPPQKISRTILWGMADSVAVRDQVAYVTDMWHGVWRFDVTNREHPVETGFFSLNSTGYRSVTLAQSYIFVAAEHAGLFILRDRAGHRDLNISQNPAHVVLYED